MKAHCIDSCLSCGSCRCLLYSSLLQGRHTESGREEVHLINNMIEHALVRLVNLVWRPGPVQHLVGQLWIADYYHLPHST